MKRDILHRGGGEERGKRRGERKEETGEGKERGEKSLRAFDTWRLLSVRYLKV